MLTSFGDWKEPAGQRPLTSVRTLPTELQNAGKPVPVGLDDSIGGRSATRYEPNKERFFGVTLFWDSESWKKFERDENFWKGGVDYAPMGLPLNTPGVRKLILSTV